MTLDCLDRRGGNSLACGVLAQIDDRRTRRQRLSRAPRQGQSLELAAFHILERLERWCGRSENHGGTGALRAQDGEVAGRIAEPAFVLLERGVMFLVDDDHAEI